MPHMGTHPVGVGSVSLVSWSSWIVVSDSPIQFPSLSVITAPGSTSISLLIFNALA